MGGGEDDTTGGEEGEELLEIFPGTDVDNYYSTMVSTLSYAAMAKYILVLFLKKFYIDL